MADSKRLVVLKAYSALLEGITLANDFQHDVQRVYRGKMTVSDSQLLPSVSILEGMNPDRDMSRASDQTTQSDWWTLLVQGWVEDDEENPLDPAYNLLADVQKATGAILDQDSFDFMLGGLIADVRIEPGVCRPPDEISVRAYFYFRVQFKLVEDLLDPYRLD